jgi:protein-L-isoaspartate(D-aspartate) O-methyltransferase
MIREASLGQVDFAAMRAIMVASQLRTSDVNDDAVIAAMVHVPREDFVPSARRETAYVDRPIPLGEGRAMNPPLATGRLLTVAQVRPGDKVLLLGDATGYVATLLHHMGAQVTVLADCARPGAVPAAVQWVKGDAARGHARGAPYDAIIVDGAIAELPKALAAQLVDGGRVAMGRIERGVTRLCSGRKAGDALGFVSHADMEMAIVPGIAPQSEQFVF